MAMHTAVVRPVALSVLADQTSAPLILPLAPARAHADLDFSVHTPELVHTKLMTILAAWGL